MHEDTITHIRAAGRPQLETVRLLGDLLDYSWPGGTDDRSDPVLRGWLRHFGAIRPATPAPSCTCAQGRCLSCQ